MADEPEDLAADLIRRLEELAEATKTLKQDIDRAARQEAERRTLRGDRRRHSRGDRRRPQ
jgi:hypothetical protein